VPGPHPLFVEALEQAGWLLVEQRQFFPTGPNPTVLVARRGRRTLRLLVYAWRITDEGQGRQKAGRSDRDYRVQTTRSHEGDLLALPGHLAAGLGWDSERELFAAFDPWIKRTTGSSSSVHITRDLLDRAAADGWAEEERPDGPECAFRAAEVPRYLGWLMALHQPRYVQLRPDVFDVEPERCHAEVSQPGKEALALRRGDHFAVVGRGGRDGQGVWQVEEVVTSRVRPDGGNQRVQLAFDARLIGRVVAV